MVRIEQLLSGCLVLNKIARQFGNAVLKFHACACEQEKTRRNVRQKLTGKIQQLDWN